MDYRWSGYGEAVAGGNLARTGLSCLVRAETGDDSATATWSQIPHLNSLRDWLCNLGTAVCNSDTAVCRRDSRLAIVTTAFAGGTLALQARHRRLQQRYRRLQA